MTDLVDTQRLISDLVNETLARERAELADALANLARERAELADHQKSEYQNDTPIPAMLARERAELADLLGALACESADLADPENISNVETDNANDNLARESAELADLLDNLPDIDLDVLVAAYWQKPDLFDALLEAIRESRD